MRKAEMKTLRILVLLMTLGIIILIVHSCRSTSYHFRSNYEDANSLLHSPNNLKTKLFLKAHLINGDVCILTDRWNIDTVNNQLTGTGTRYDFNRHIIYRGSMSLPIDSVAIFETNNKLVDTERDRILVLTTLAIANSIGTFMCILNPKACFGSCPTFYTEDINNIHYADAEGFSSAIAPSMEYGDIDALNNNELLDKQFSLIMKNEALETHCVKNVKLLAYPREKGEKVYHSGKDEFYLCENLYTPTDATDESGRINDLLTYMDIQERFSYADSKNLAQKETIFLTFDNINQNDKLGLVLHFRQTLMTTYFIYSALEYMGDEVSDYFAKIEGNNELMKKLNGGMKELLGDIDVYVLDEKNNTWQFQGGLNETGPIAINKQIVPLKNSNKSNTIKLKLILNKGLWRIDYAALTNIKSKVEPIEIQPSSILNKGKTDFSALEKINSPNDYLISMPGNEFKLNFILPEKRDYELFLFAKGYYLEWMREEWLAGKNSLKLKQLFEKPEAYLKDEAANYKVYETTMEQVFWNSKINTKTFTNYDN